MNLQQALNYWIQYAVQQSTDEQSELFYFDKKNNEFFSILSIDNYLFDKKLNSIPGISLYYTTEELSQLKERFKKIKSKKNSIIVLPRKGIQSDPSELTAIIDTFLSVHKIDLKTCSLSETVQKEPVPLEKRGVTNQQSSKKWWEIWKSTK